MRLIPLLMVTGGLVASANAQLGRPVPDVSWPAQAASLELETPIQFSAGKLHDALLGAVRNASGRYWISARRARRAGTTSPHRLFQLDAKGAVTKTVDQPKAVQASHWGIRDLAYDGSKYLFGSCELAAAGHRIFAFDTQTATWAPAQDFLVPKTLILGTARGLAYDPKGASGKGSLWLSDFRGPLVEIDRSGKILRSYQLPLADVFGLALHPTTGDLWVLSQAGSTHPSAPGLVALGLDTQTGKWTGSMMLGDFNIPGATPGGIAAGAEFFVEKGKAILLVLTQGTKDHLLRLDGDLLYGSSSGGRPVVSGDVPWPGNANWTVELNNSSAQSALLILGTGPWNIALPVPAFAVGSNLLVDLGRPNVLFGIQPVTQGTASLRLPLPATPVLAGTSLYFQWLELTVSGGKLQPMALSLGATIYIHP